MVGVYLGVVNLTALLHTVTVLILGVTAVLTLGLLCARIVRDEVRRFFDRTSRPDR